MMNIIGFVLLFGFVVTPAALIAGCDNTLLLDCSRLNWR